MEEVVHTRTAWVILDIAMIEAWTGMSRSDESDGGTISPQQPLCMSHATPVSLMQASLDMLHPRLYCLLPSSINRRPERARERREINRPVKAVLDMQGEAGGVCNIV